MKRVLLFFVLLVMVSGCSINYNIKIEDGSIRDSLELNISNSEYRNYASSVKDEPIDSDTRESGNKINTCTVFDFGGKILAIFGFVYYLEFIS